MFAKCSDLCAGAVLLGVAAAMYAATPGPGETIIAEVDVSLAPRMVSLLFGFLSLLLFCKGLYACIRTRGIPESGKPLFTYPAKLAASVLLTLLAAVAFDAIGFRLTAMLYIFSQGYVLSFCKGEFKPMRMAAIACVLPFVIYYLFGTWFALPLPAGIL